MSECFQLIFSGLVTISTIVYAILTWKLVSETRKMRQIQITPDISIYFEKSEADTSFIYIKVENFGYGIAKDVKFTIIEDFNIYDFEHERFDKGVFKYGVKNFYPRQQFKYLFTDLSKKHDAKLKEKLEIKINYHDLNDKPYEKLMILTLDEFTGMGLITPPDSYLGRVAYELKNIKDILKTDKKKKNEI